MESVTTNVIYIMTKTVPFVQPLSRRYEPLHVVLVNILDHVQAAMINFGSKVNKVLNLVLQSV